MLQHIEKDIQNTHFLMSFFLFFHRFIWFICNLEMLSLCKINKSYSEKINTLKTVFLCV